MLGKIIEAQDELEISDEDMPPILEHIQSLIRDAEKRFLSWLPPIPEKTQNQTAEAVGALTNGFCSCPR